MLTILNSPQCQTQSMTIVIRTSPPASPHESVKICRTGIGLVLTLSKSWMEKSRTAAKEIHRQRKLLPRREGTRGPLLQLVWFLHINAQTRQNRGGYIERTRSHIWRRKRVKLAHSIRLCSRLRRCRRRIWRRRTVQNCEFWHPKVRLSRAPQSIRCSRPWLYKLYSEYGGCRRRSQRHARPGLGQPWPASFQRMDHSLASLVLWSR